MIREVCSGSYRPLSFKKGRLYHDKDEKNIADEQDIPKRTGDKLSDPAMWLVLLLPNRFGGAPPRTRVLLGAKTRQQTQREAADARTADSYGMPIVTVAVRLSKENLGQGKRRTEA